MLIYLDYLYQYLLYLVSVANNLFCEYQIGMPPSVGLWGLNNVHRLNFAFAPFSPSSFLCEMPSYVKKYLLRITHMHVF